MVSHGGREVRGWQAVKQGFTLNCACAQPGKLVKGTFWWIRTLVSSRSYTAGTVKPLLSKEGLADVFEETNLFSHRSWNHTEHAQLQGGRKCNPSILEEQNGNSRAQP